MSNIRNSVTLMGNLGADPEFKKFDNGKTLTKLRLATNEFYKNRNGERVQLTQWHTCVAWGKQAELMNDLLAKGKEVLVRGKLTYRSYENAEGVSKLITEVIVNEFSLTGKKEAIAV